MTSPLFSPQLVPLSLLLLLASLCSPVSGCFSSGGHSNENPEVAGLQSANSLDDHSSDELQLDSHSLLTYLREFGHLSSPRDTRAQDPEAELQQGIKHFQEFMGMRPSGKLELPVLARMNWKRCGNPDDAYAGEPIWERSSLFWFLGSPPPASLSLQEIKELIRQAFAAWEIVIAMEFLETSKARDAHIEFLFEDERSRGNANRTGLAIARASPPPASRIVLNRNENWTVSQSQEEGKVDIFLVLIHEIGHALGLKHTGEQDSVMFPMLERTVGEQLPVISNDDVERLRALYESNERRDPHSSSAPQNLLAAPPSRQQKLAPEGTESTGSPRTSTPRPDQGPEKCPHKIWAATSVANDPGTLLMFGEREVWLFRQGRAAGGPFQISELFPDGPDLVDVAFSSGQLTVLAQGHTLFGYQFDPLRAQFTRARGFPRELHNRILFYPEAAFPIANGSIILIKDKVFATYNVESNTPHMLGNVDEFFPNLPQKLRSGFPASPDFSSYHMLTPDYAFLYDVRLTRPVASQTIGEFLGCDVPQQRQQPKTGQQSADWGLGRTAGATSVGGAGVLQPKMVQGQGPPAYPQFNSAPRQGHWKRR